MKKFEQLGRSLSKEQQKKIRGGDYGGYGGDCAWTYAGCNSGNPEYFPGTVTCDYVDCNGVEHCGYECKPGDGAGCR